MATCFVLGVPDGKLKSRAGQGVCSRCHVPLGGDPKGREEDADWFPPFRGASASSRNEAHDLDMVLRRSRPTKAMEMARDSWVRRRDWLIQTLGTKLCLLAHEGLIETGRGAVAIDYNVDPSTESKSFKYWPLEVRDSVIFLSFLHLGPNLSHFRAS